MKKFNLFIVAFLLVFSNISHASSAIPTTVSYSKQSGTFLYCNNPEFINEGDLADNGSIIYEELIPPGDAQAIFEHLNCTNQIFKYGVQVYNPNSTTLTVKVKRKGDSTSGWNGAPAWYEFYNDTSIENITIPSGRSKWIYISNSVSHANVVSGVIEFNVNNYAIVNFYAFRNISYAEDGSARYIGFITSSRADWFNPPNYILQNGVYKGEAPNLPILTETFNWSISDSTSGYLPVKYNNKQYDMLQTNTHEQANQPNAFLDDIFEFTVPLKNGGTTYINRSENLANWGVQYRHNIVIKNTGSKTRTVEVGVYTISNGAGKRLVMKTPNGISDAYFNRTGEKVYYTFNVQAGSTITKLVESVMPLPSSEGIWHFVRLKNNT
ncbi:hypothetical protein HZI73_01330 [Vallitalea pronyensis]|uniref:Uncharacterized protein n=1 Tax=Vallitalea pronyensis TaxID=1348613 RepID=A0A8J8MFU9_9FIRM|nr:hypothetical protein [Vallitalea pronyensis]QUI21017.1 hypothetical protein HZI73_01330 [Vallitalea pronyensis]